MSKQLKYQIVSEYPKGDSRHYDTGNPKGLLKTKIFNQNVSCKDTEKGR